MFGHRLGNFLVLFATAFTFSGCAFSALSEDLEKLADVTYPFKGTVTTEALASDALIIVASRDARGENIARFSFMYGDGEFEMLLDPSPMYFFGFNDLNKDLRFQLGEPYGWASDGRVIDPRTSKDLNIQIHISSLLEDQHPVPELLVGKRLDEHFNDLVSFNFGTLSTLDNPLFSKEQSEKGLWQPFAFMEDGGTGIHMLEPYDPEKVPVLFVHGILGTPQEFSDLIGQLDKSRYQAWVFSYPSGLKLPWLAGGIAKFLEVTHTRMQFDELHIIAHSMGGLVSRGGINLCAQANTCNYIRSFTSISTPWNGVASARSGVKWAPKVVPVWYDLDPDSDFVTTLFDVPLPEGVPYYLLFGFKQDSIFGGESGDGVIDLVSQLRQAAQNDASQMHGYDEGHVSILSNESLIEHVHKILNGPEA